MAFAGAGFGFASWASRIPQVKARLDLDPSQLGILLLSLAAGSVISLPLAGPIVARFGSRRTVTVTGVLGGLGLVVVAVGYRIGVAPVAAGLFCWGAAAGTWDVAMNVQGAVVERLLGRSIMPRFHAGFSLGTVAAALGGAVMVALGVSVTVHLAIVGVIVGIGVPWAVRGFVPDSADAVPSTSEPTGAAGPGEYEPAGARESLRAWRESRTLLIGLFVLAFAFAEGTGNDWISLATIDRHHVAPAVGTLVFATFLGAMTTARWFGPTALDRYGRVPVVRVLAVLAIAGLVLFVFGPGLVLAFVGAVLWGTGTSLGFPVGMSAGADEPASAAPRVGVISTIGYCAFLAGPPLIGFLAERSSVPHALVTVIALMLVAGAIAGSVRPPRAVTASRRRAGVEQTSN
ncbi:MAG TPA: MFS transporter [Solirubrobacteraceae bacterium]|nr:MFS transporter [Solirubrobacteraceae bacterium]